RGRGALLHGPVPGVPERRALRGARLADRSMVTRSIALAAGGLALLVVGAGTITACGAILGIDDVDRIADPPAAGGAGGASSSAGSGASSSSGGGGDA